jgi:steroid 5-alpha reductase family enzyme
MTNLVLTCWAALAIALALLWARQLKTKNATSVDVAWSAGLGVLACIYPWFLDGDFEVRLLVGMLGATWAFRLAWYLLSDRVVRSPEEDGRYRAIRDYFGPRASLFFFFFYQGQAAAVVLFSLPMLAAMNGQAMDIWTWFGASVWILAISGEATADSQLARFRHDPVNRGRVCKVGMWRYSRHPNYFFEWLHWWAYVLIGHGTLLTWIGPVGMLVFLFRLTGIRYTEDQALKSRGDEYREYQRTTSAFIPWSPKRVR